MTVVRPDQPAAPLTPVENSRRIVPIFANLMPTEVVDTRRGRRARGLTLTGLILLVVAIAGVYAVTWMQTSSAQDELDDTQAQVAELKRQQNKFSEVVQIQTDSKLLEQQLTRLMASDLSWSAVLSDIRAAVPSGTDVTAVSVTLTPKEENATNTENAGLPSESKEKLIGTVGITGVAPSKPVIAAFLDALSKVDGLADPYITSITETENGRQFTMRLALNGKVLGGRFDEAGKTTGGK